MNIEQADTYVGTMGKIVGILTGVVTALYAFWKKIWPWLVQKTLADDLLTARLDRMTVQIKEVHDTIQKELKTNGGSSVKDEVRKLYHVVKRMEMRQILLEQTQRAFLNAAHYGYWKADAEGKFIEVSKELCTITGRTESELMGDNWLNWVIEEDRERIYQEWQLTLNSAKDFVAEFTIIRTDNTYQKVKGIAYQLKDESQLLGLYGILTPVGRLFSKEKTDEN